MIIINFKNSILVVKNENLGLVKHDSTKNVVRLFTMNNLTIEIKSNNEKEFISLIDSLQNILTEKVKHCSVEMPNGSYIIQDIAHAATHTDLD